MARKVYRQNKRMPKKAVLKKFANFVGKTTYKTAKKSRPKRRFKRRFGPKRRFRRFKKRRY